MKGLRIMKAGIIVCFVCFANSANAQDLNVTQMEEILTRTIKNDEKLFKAIRKYDSPDYVTDSLETHLRLIYQNDFVIRAS